MRTGISIGLGMGRVASGIPLGGSTWTAYWDADVGVAVTSGEVTSWTDRVGGFVMTPPVNKPTYVQTWTGGRNALRFTSADSERLLCTDAAVANVVNGTDKAFSVFIQLNAVSLAASQIVWCFYLGSNNAHRYSLIHNSTVFVTTAGDGALLNKTWALGAGTSTDRIVAHVEAGTAQTFFRDGAADANNPGAINQAARSIDRLELGALQGTSPVNAFVRRLAIMPSAATESQRAAIFAAWAF